MSRASVLLIHHLTNESQFVTQFTLHNIVTQREKETSFVSFYFPSVLTKDTFAQSGSMPIDLENAKSTIIWLELKRMNWGSGQV